MRCPKCHHENQDEMKFCGEYGTKLERPCARCGASNPPAHRFCF
ncbi:MAG: zinc-ribbon domain-containing protein [Pedosphaera sp.]|nr:zinc-ribbon domain-containing protein [Pedosphaera sp.]